MSTFFLMEIELKLDDEVNAFLAGKYGAISTALEKLPEEWGERINASIREEMKTATQK